MKLRTSEISATDLRPRRNFLYFATGAVAAAGGTAALWPLIGSLNPDADAIAKLPVEYDLSAVRPGQRITLKWRNMDIFIARRTREEIARARADDHAKLKDPEPDGARVQHAEWLIVQGYCTHLGCALHGQSVEEHRGDFGGWFCPCHASHFDVSGRVRKGPAPENLVIPRYRFIDAATLEISWGRRGDGYSHAAS